MKERGILFSAPMVRALLAGTKTQTRRAVKPQPPAVVSSVYLPHAHEPNNWQGYAERDGLIHWYGRCPYGQPGDRLWVRETFMHHPADYCWEASVSIPCRPAETVYRADFPDSRPGEGWTPAIHMPRALSRITLEITAVRVEKLQEISEADAQAEGVLSWATETRPAASWLAVDLYRALWESINGAGSWDANPWDWALMFRRLP